MNTSLKILLVEDLEEDRRLLTEFLTNRGYRIYLATDGLEAIQIAEKVQPDLILMDINMPNCDGHTAAFRIRSIPALASTPLIFLTAAVSPFERVKGLKSGAVDYITKPYDFEEVSLRLDVHLGYLAAARKQQPASADAKASSHQERLDEALFQATSGRLLANLTHTPTLGQLACELRTNTKRLNAAFKSRTGKTVFEYLRDLRMQEAARLLDQSLLEIGEIAGLVGFRTAAGFTTAFREFHGMTPSDYRNQHNNA